nr:hypothetical protein GCM10020092_080680 [Actinoplanes digitatis]
MQQPQRGAHVEFGVDADSTAGLCDDAVDSGQPQARKVFAYLERCGISREDAVTPREDREDLGGDKQRLVLAFFDTEDAADQAASALRDWEKTTEYMKVDAVGVLVKDDDGKVKEHKLGKRAEASVGWASASPSA